MRYIKVYIININLLLYKQTNCVKLTHIELAKIVLLYMFNSKINSIYKSQSN